MNDSEFMKLMLMVDTIMFPMASLNCSMKICLQVRKWGWNSRKKYSSGGENQIHNHPIGKYKVSISHFFKGTTQSRKK